MMRWTLSAVLHRQRSLGLDGASQLRAVRPRPRVIGIRNIPAEGPFIVALNHYERPQLPVWFAVLFVSAAVHHRSPAGRSIGWMVTDRLYHFHLGPVIIPDPWMRWFLRRLANVYGLILVGREDVRSRAISLRQAGRALRRPGAMLMAVGVTPEGAGGGGRHLARAAPNAGRALAWLSRGTVPIVPAAVYESPGGSLTLRFGEPFVLQSPAGATRSERDVLATRVMCAIAALLPPELRGPYGAKSCARS